MAAPPVFLEGLTDATRVALHHAVAMAFADVATPDCSTVNARVVAAVQARLIELALYRCDNNQVHAARLLGMNRNTLAKLMRRYGLKVGA